MQDAVANAKSIEKGITPTATVACAAIAIDIHYVSSKGLSPAFMSKDQVVGSLDASMFYFLCIVTLTGLFWIIPALAIAMTFNLGAYQLVKYPFKKIKPLRLHFQHSRRGTVKTEAVRTYARLRNDKELLEKLTEREKSQTKLAYFTPSFALLSLLLLAYISSPEHPNFMMRVCTSEIPARACALYYVVYMCAVCQSVLLMALHGFVTLNLTRTRLEEFGVDREEYLKFMSSEKELHYGIERAKRKWMRGNGQA